METFLPFVFSIMIFLLFVLLLSLGYMLAGKRIKGSCGGLAVEGRNGEILSCDTCPNKHRNKNCENRAK